MQLDFTLVRSQSEFPFWTKNRECRKGRWKLNSVSARTSANLTDASVTQEWFIPFSLACCFGSWQCKFVLIRQSHSSAESARRLAWVWSTTDTWSRFPAEYPGLCHVYRIKTVSFAISGTFLNLIDDMHGTVEPDCAIIGGDIIRCVAARSSAVWRTLHRADIWWGSKEGRASLWVSLVLSNA